MQTLLATMMRKSYLSKSKPLSKKYCVEKLLAKWASKGEVRYLTKWVDYDDATWNLGSDVDWGPPHSYEEQHRLGAVDTDPYLHFPGMRRTPL